MTDHELFDNVQDTALNLLLAEPFFGYLLSGINKRRPKDDKQRTAIALGSLSVTTISMNIREDLWVNLDKQSKLSAFKKEIMHYILYHPWAERPKDRGFFEMSCDISANKYANDQNSISEKNISNLAKKYLGTNINHDGWDEVYADIDKMKRAVHAKATKEEAAKWTAEAAIGNIMDSQKNLTEAIFYLPQGAKGSPNPGDINDLVKQMKGQGASDSEISQAIQDMVSEGGDKWADIKENTSDAGIQETVKNSLQAARQAGNIPGGMQALIDHILAPPKVDWRKELRDFTSRCGSVTSKTTHAKRSKRWKTFPSIKIVTTRKIAIITDTSGSVSDKEFELFINEINGILQEGTILYFIQADTVVDRVDEYKTRFPPEFQIYREGCGGTYFDPALEFVKTRGRDQDKFDPIDAVDGVIYLTDGYAPAPKLESYPLCKTLWITTQKSVEQMENEGFRDRIVFLDIND